MWRSRMAWTRARLSRPVRSQRRSQRSRLGIESPCYDSPQGCDRVEGAMAKNGMSGKTTSMSQIKSVAGGKVDCGGKKGK